MPMEELRFTNSREFRQGILAGCECCNNNTIATFEIVFGNGHDDKDDQKVNVCPAHRDMAEHSFLQFFDEWILAAS